MQGAHEVLSSLPDGPAVYVLTHLATAQIDPRVKVDPHGRVTIDRSVFEIRVYRDDDTYKGLPSTCISISPYCCLQDSFVPVDVPDHHPKMEFADLYIGGRYNINERRDFIQIFFLDDDNGRHASAVEFADVLVRTMLEILDA